MLKLVVWTQFHLLEMEWQKMVRPDLDMFFLKRTMILFILWFSSDILLGKTLHQLKSLSAEISRCLPRRIPLSQPPLKTFVFFLKHGCTVPQNLSILFSRPVWTMDGTAHPIFGPWINRWMHWTSDSGWKRWQWVENSPVRVRSCYKSAWVLEFKVAEQAQDFGCWSLTFFFGTKWKTRKV